jgi:ubiquinone/menaquinone biosynthesis C-methylase UbiE
MRYLTPTQARRFYDRFGRLQDTQSLYERAALKALLDAGSFENAHAVIEFGCGTGRLAATILAQLPPDARYRGIDNSTTMVRLARDRLRPFGARATVNRSDGSTRMPLADASVDRVLSTYVLDLLNPNDARELLAEAHRVLQPDGRLCLASFTHGTGRLSRPLTQTVGWLSAHHPLLTGGCRPIELLDLLPDSDWHIEHRHVVTSYAIPSETIVAEPR